MVHSSGAGLGRLRPSYRPTHLVGMTTLIYLLDGLALTFGTVFHARGTNAAWVLALLAVLALGMAAYPVLRGPRFGRGQATAMLLAQVVAVGFMSHSTHIDLAALGDGLSLPVLGAYASWLLAWPAAVVFYGGLSLWVVAIADRGDSYLTAVALMLVVQAIITTELVRAMRRNVRRVTDTDPLTGILNRRALERSADKLLTRDGTLTVALIDLDNLREVNNTAGHLAGDALLIQAAHEWSAAFGRAAVTAGRIGGDEFVLLFDDVDEDTARSLLAGVQATSSVRWTAGVAQVRTGESLDQVLARADADMYQRKGTGEPTTTAIVPLGHAAGPRSVEAQPSPRRGWARTR